MIRSVSRYNRVTAKTTFCAKLYCCRELIWSKYILWYPPQPRSRTPSHSYPEIRNTAKYKGFTSKTDENSEFCVWPDHFWTYFTFYRLNFLIKLFSIVLGVGPIPYLTSLMLTNSEKVQKPPKTGVSARPSRRGLAGIVVGTRVFYRSNID